MLIPRYKDAASGYLQCKCFHIHLITSWKIRRCTEEGELILVLLLMYSVF